MFDAGSISASLTVDLSEFSRDMDQAEARSRRFEDAKHEIRFTAVFDDSDISRARSLFAQLDNQLSRDAANRLRSSPQGSVLGSLNALFSPHPVTGGPNASQAAQQGLLGKMVSGSGGGIGSTVTRADVVGDVISGGDRENLAKAGKAAADDVIDGAKSEGKRRGGIIGALLGAGSSLSGMLGRFGGHGGDGGGGGEGGEDESFLDRGLIGAIGPGILGVNTKWASILGLGASAVGALPALTGSLLGAGLVGGGAALDIKNNQQLQNQAKGVLSSLEGIVGNAAKPLTKPLESAFSQLGGFVKQIGPQIGSVFKAVVPFIQPLTYGLEGLVGGLLPGLISILKAAAPAMKVFSGFVANVGVDLGKMLGQFSTVIGPSSVLLKALLGVVTGLLPFIGGLAQVMASVLAPAFLQFAGVIRGLLPSLVTIGKVLAQFAGAVLTDIAGGLGIVAGVLKAVTPAVGQLAGAIGNVFDTLENKGVLAQFGDILENLATPLGNLISTLVTDLLPELPSLLSLFTSLVNVVSTIGTSGIAPVLTALNNAMPSLATAFLQLVQAVLSPGMVSAITNLVTQLALLVAKVAPGVVTDLASALTSIITALTQPGVISAVTGVVNGLAGLVSKVPAGTVKDIALGLIGIAAGVKAIRIGQGVLGSLSSLVGTLKGLPGVVSGAWSKIFGGGGQEATVDVAADGMQTAGDTMVTAAEMMQKAADTMTGATLEGDAGAAGAAGESAAAEEAAAVGGSIGGALLRGGIVVAIAAAITQSLVKPFLQGKRISVADPQPGQSANGNWWDNPAHANPLSPNPRDQGLSTWAGLGTILKDWTGFGQSGSPISAQQRARLTSQHIQLPAVDPNAGEFGWTKIWQSFDKTVIHPIQNWLTQSLPHFFTSAIPTHIWSPAYQGFQRDFAGKITSWFTKSLPEAVTKGIPDRLWSPAYEGFMRTIGSPVSSFFTSTLPSLFTRAGSAVVTFFEELPSRIVGALSGLGRDLLAVGENAIGSLVGGLESSVPGGSGIGRFVGSALSAVGLANGGLLTEPVIGFGTQTGRTYTLAENEPEWVVPSSMAGGGAGGYGSPAAGGDTYITVVQPEGSTLAQAFNDIKWQLNVMKMQGFTGTAP